MMAFYGGKPSKTPSRFAAGFFLYWWTEISYFCGMEFSQSRHAEIAALVAQCIGFEWDAGNIGKNWDSHNVAENESEEVFNNAPLMFGDDTKHSMHETRFMALGKTDGNRLVSNMFTIRGNLVRIISSQDMSKGNRRTYGTAST